MKKILILTIGIFLLSCQNVREKPNAKNRRCKNIACLDIYYNLDSLQVNKIIAEKKTLLLFTAWNMRGATVLDSVHINDTEVFDALSKYTIIVQYVDDKAKFHANDSKTIGNLNLQYERANFSMAIQPFYIIYINGLPKCTSVYLGEKKEGILGFLNECRSNTSVDANQ